MSMLQNEKEETGIKHAVNPGKSTLQRVDNLSKFGELYKMLSAIKRRMEMQFFAIPPQIYIRSDLKRTEKQNLLDEDYDLRNSLSLDDLFWINNTFISKSVIREAEKVFLKDRETFLWVEVFQNNMYLAVTRSTGKREDPFQVEYFQYDRTFVPHNDITNSDIFNGIGVSIQAYLMNGYIQTEFDEQNTIPIIFCFTDFLDSNSPIEQIATRVWDRSTFKGGIVGKNYCKEIARALQLIDSKKKIEFTTISPLNSSNFLSYYCFETIDENKRPAANYAFLSGLLVQEFLDCKRIKPYELKKTNLTKIYPDSVTRGKDSKSVIVSNEYARIGGNYGFERRVIYKYLTLNERNYFDLNVEELRFLYSRIASPLKVAQLLQTYIRNHPLFLNHEKLEEKPIVDMQRFDYFLQEEYKDHGLILHPYTFELIGKEINTFAKFIMKRCLSFSAVALLSAIERKYYTQIEPKYSAGSSPIIRISIREDDRGLAKNFEDSIVEYLDNGAEIFWTQRRQDLKAPTFEIVVAPHSMISGSHVYTKYIRTLIPKDYWDEKEDESNREEIRERKRKYKITWDERMEEIQEFDKLVEQALNHIATLESSKEIDFSNVQDKKELKSTIEKMCGFDNIGNIEKVYYSTGPKFNLEPQTKAETISLKNNPSKETNPESDGVFRPKNSQRPESGEQVLRPSSPADFNEKKVNSETRLTDTENRVERIERLEYAKAKNQLLSLPTMLLLLHHEVLELFKAFTTVCEYLIQNSNSQIETHYLLSLRKELSSLRRQEYISDDELRKLDTDYRYLFCGCDKCNINKILMENTDITKLKNIDEHRTEDFLDAYSVIYAIGNVKSIEEKDVPMISKSLSIIADYNIDKGTNLRQAHYTRRTLDKLRANNSMNREGLIAEFEECLKYRNYVELRDYNNARSAYRKKGMYDYEEEQAVRQEDLNKYEKAMKIVNDLDSKGIEDESEVFFSTVVVLKYDLHYSRSYAQSFLVLNTIIETNKIVKDTPNKFEVIKGIMKTYLERRKAVRGGKCPNNDKKKAKPNGRKNHPIKRGKKKGRGRR